MFSIFYSFRPRAEDLLLAEMKKNPLALERLESVNKIRKANGKPAITVKIINDLPFDGMSNDISGEIEIKNTLSKSKQLLTLIFEICNICRNQPLLSTRRYPIRRANYIKRAEKCEHEAGREMIKIFQYGVDHLGWDAEILKEEKEFFQQPFNEFFESIEDRHKEYFGENWDQFTAEQEGEPTNQIIN